MPVYHVTDGEGLTVINPSEQCMRRMLRDAFSLAERDPGERDEFEEITLFNDEDGQALAVFPDGRILYEDPHRLGSRRRILAEIKEGEALALWLALIEGDQPLIENQAWEWLDED